MSPTTWADGTSTLRSASELEAFDRAFAAGAAEIDAYRSYGVRADGTDQATNLQNALNAARDAGPGTTLRLPPGIILTAGPLLFDTDVWIKGAGQNATVVKQADLSNITGIFKSRDYDSLAGTTSNAGQTRFSISDLCIDGGKTNNVAVETDGLQIFGYRYYVHDLSVRGCLGSGINAEWGTPGSPSNSGEPYQLGGQTGPMEAFWNNIRCYFNVKSGMVFNGPNDAVLTNIFLCMNAFKAQGPDPAIFPNLWIKSKSLACLLINSHVWNGGNYGMQFDAGVDWFNNTAEGAQDAQVYITVPVRMVGGYVFASAAMIYSTKVGIKFGPSGSAQINGLYMTDCIGGFFDFTTGGAGASYIEAFVFGSTVMPLYLGTPSNQGVYHLYGNINGEKVSNLLPKVSRLLVTNERTDLYAMGLEDDFLTGSLTSGQIGKLDWTTYFTGSASVSNVAPSGGHPGVIRFSTGATNPSVAAIGLAATTAGAFTINDEHDQVFMIKPQVGSGCTVRVGTCVDPSNSAPADGVYFECLPADTHWFGVCRVGGVQTRVDTGVTATLFGWVRLRIRWYFTSSLRFQFIVGTQTGAVAASEVSTNLPATSFVVQPFVQIASSTASDKLLDIDYYGLRLVNLNR